MTPFTFDIRIAAEGKLLVDIRDFTFRREQVTFLLGESGIGKTLISRALYGLLDPVELNVTINGRRYSEYVHSREVREIQRQGFFVFQEPSSHLNPLMTLGEQLREGSLARATDQPEVVRALWKGTREDDVASILAVYPKPYRPSGGEKQRILLAMALEKIDMLPEGDNRPPGTLFIFDEPSGSLDNHYRDLFLGLLLERFRKNPFTALVITHDYSMISRVTETYPEMMHRVSFQELTRRGTTLALHEFRPGTYTSWVKGLRGPEEPLPDREPALTIRPELEVFGRRLVITRDPEGSEPAPLTVRRGSMVYLKAPSGTGKTTVVKKVMGLIPGGRMEARLDDIRLDGKTPRKFFQERIWGKRMTMVFQHADEALNMHSTMRETLLGLPARIPLTEEGISRLVGELFDAEEYAELMGKRVRSLSGGQKQRLNLLRSFALDTAVLILDEPLNGLDFDSSTRVITVLNRKMRSGAGLLVISHNEEIFDALAGTDQTYYLHFGSASTRPPEREAENNK